ncbi:galactose-specific lectin nattectin-like isoform X1 [Macrobrachium nipponense]|uniref:galactose-specific lectin nattectin-like isoform X1 n=1 Tax=Macrobrachium nipponense TaxID=159736 RepID=UPI0030C890FF
MDRTQFLFILLGMGLPTLVLGEQAGGCPAPFDNIGGHCIFVDSIIAGTWYEMRAHCLNMSSTMVNLGDANLFHDVVAYINANGLTNANYWIGARDEGHEAQWLWEDGSNVKMGTPYWGYVKNNYQMPEGSTGQNCALLDASNYFYFNDVSCDAVRNVICQFD